VLIPPALVGEVAACDHDLGVDTLHQFVDRPLEVGLMKCSARADMQVRDVKDAC
jgi:hypothetical protein